MSSNFESPPPPPASPLPPLNSSSLNSRKSSLKDESTDPEQIVIDTCQRMSYSIKQQLQQQQNDITLISIYNHCPTILQSGPTCGLVALLMSINLIDKNQNQLNLSLLLQKAQSYGLTKFGEIFSVKSMIELIRKQFPAVKVDHRLGLSESINDILVHLYRGLPILIPYDTDHNYEPTLRNGERAHWAMLCGFCLIDTNHKFESEFESWNIPCHVIDGIKLYNLSKKYKCPEMLEYLQRHSYENQLLIYARHGKSKYLNLWNLADLIDSNKNLRQISRKILDDNQRKYMIYPANGDLHQSLSDQFILIYE